MASPALTGTTPTLTEISVAAASACCSRETGAWSSPASRATASGLGSRRAGTATTSSWATLTASGAPWRSVMMPREAEIRMHRLIWAWPARCSASPWAWRSHPYAESATSAPVVPSAVVRTHLGPGFRQRGNAHSRRRAPSRRAPRTRPRAARWTVETAPP